MKVNSKLLAVLLSIISAPISLLAQDYSGSVYSRYGYGILADPSFGAQKAMGGIGYGLRESKTINPLNPASYSSIDSLTFMIDLGASFQMNWLNDGFEKSKSTNASLDYVAMQFPLYKNLGMGLGFTPVSDVGYKVGNSGTSSETSYYGSGGLNQLYGALSYNFKRVSIGANASYLFGNIKHYKQASFSDATTNVFLNSDTLRMSGFTIDLGVQYRQPIGKNQHLIIGAIYKPKISVTGKYSGNEITYNSSGYIQTTTPLKPKGTGYDMPETYGLGISYVKGSKFLAGFDYSYQKWEDVRFEGQQGIFDNRTKFNFGTEFTPDARSRNYFSRVHYRLGANYANSYFSPVSSVDKQQHQFSAYSVTCGFGLPLIGGRSALNVAFEYAETSPETKNVGLVDEKCFRLTVSYTFNELWFFQRKVQ